MSIAFIMENSYNMDHDNKKMNPPESQGTIDTMHFAHRRTHCHRKLKKY